MMNVLCQENIMLRYVRIDVRVSECLNFSIAVLQYCMLSGGIEFTVCMSFLAG